MREGLNPNKLQKTKITPPASVTVGVLSYIPEQTGYFSGALDALKLCLASIRSHADQPHDILVVDNASCTEVRTYLEDELLAGRIDYLLLNSRNLGKGNAVYQILRAAPGEYVFFTDSDIYFKPGWMQAHLEIAHAFPEAGLIGGVPLRHVIDHYTASTQRWVENHQDNLVIEKGHTIPEAWIRDYIRSLGYADPEKYLNDWLQFQECRLTYQGVSAYIGASHMQYLMPQPVIAKLPYYRFEYTLGSKEEAHFIDKALDEQGLLRLSTAQPYVYHIGNAILEDWLREEYTRLIGDKPAEVRRQRRQNGWWSQPVAQRFIKRVHQWSFEHYQK